MTILFITKNYPPAICGVGDHTAQLAIQMRGMGHRVLIYTGTRGAADGEEGVFGGRPFDRHMLEELRQLIASEAVDHLFWQYVPYSFHEKGLPTWLPAVMKALRTTGVKQSVFFHEVSLRLWGDGLRQSVAGRIQRQIAGGIMRSVDHAFTSIPLYQSYFRGKQPVLVPVGSNLPVPAKEINVEKNRIVCFANRADKALFEALTDTRKSLPVELWLCGAVSGSKREEIADWIKANDAGAWVRVTGEMDAQSLSNLIASGAIFIQPQITDRRGLGGISAKNGTVMAAMSMGRPIITCEGDMTDPSLFRDGENMLFVPYGNAEAYHEAILRLLTDQPLAQKLGAAARTAYETNAAWGIVANRLTEGFR